MKAALLRVETSKIRIRRADGRIFTLPIANLSPADQTYVRSAALRMNPPSWPDKISVSKRDVEIRVVEENEREKRFVYRSRDFQFVSEDKLAGSVMKEIAQTFESTRSLLLELPWMLRCEPPQGSPLFLCELFKTRDSYVAAGGPPNTGGVYMSSDQVFRIPFASLGLEQRAETWYKDEQYSNRTLIHEITHQMMDEVLPVLPIWVIEGTAEYTQALPYKTGTFRASSHEEGFREVMGLKQDRDRSFHIESLEALMNMTPATWHEQAKESMVKMRDLYQDSYLLVYFFCHLDGEGTGASFQQFMDAIRSEAQERKAFLADPRVVMTQEGGLTWPRTMGTPGFIDPQHPFRHLPVLLKGRSYSELATQIQDAFSEEHIEVTVRP